MSENTLKIEGLLGMLTVKLQDDNFVKWSYQFFTSENPCPPKFVIHTETGVTKEITDAYKSC